MTRPKKASLAGRRKFADNAIDICGKKVGTGHIDEFGFDRLERTEAPQAASLLYKVLQNGPPLLRPGDHRPRLDQTVS